jgi:hypothetical protein
MNSTDSGDLDVNGRNMLWLSKNTVLVEVEPFGLGQGLVMDPCEQPLTQKKKKKKKKKRAATISVLHNL